MRLAFVGTGRLTRVLGHALARAGHEVTVVGRTSARARSAARAVGGRGTVRLATVAAVEALVLAVPDRVIGEVATALAGAVDANAWRGRVVLHAAGALGPEVLAPLAGLGAATGVLHPLQVLGDGADANVLAGSAARVEGGPAAVRLASRLARDAGLEPFRLPHGSGERERIAYHAAASLAANDAVALLAWAVDLLEESGVPRRQAERALARLAIGSADQVGRHGLAAALSGPVARGDVGTLAAHLERLAELAPAAAAVHRLLAARLVDLDVDERNALDHGTRRALRRLLAGRDGDPTV